MTYQPGYQTPGTPQYQPGYYEAPGQYANWLLRVGAYVVDAVIVDIPVWVFIFIGALIGRNPDGTLNGLYFAFAFIGAIASLVLAVWNLFIRQGSTGQSLGKSVLGIRLISLQSGQPIGGGMAFVRYLCHIVDSIACYLGWLWPIWDARRQTFADKIVNTVVVRA